MATILASQPVDSGAMVLGDLFAAFIHDLSAATADLKMLNAAADADPYMFSDVEARVAAAVAQFEVLEDCVTSEEADVTRLQTVLDAALAMEKKLESNTVLIDSQGIGMPAPEPARVVPQQSLRPPAAGPSAVSKPSKAKPSKGPGRSRSSSRLAVAPPPVPGASPRSQSTPRGGASRKGKPCNITSISYELLQSVPKYLRGRLTIGQLDQAVAEVNEFLSKKYQLLGTPVRKLWGGDLSQVEAWKKQGNKETKGKPFFCHADVKGMKAFKNSTGKSVLQVMRHLKLVQCISGGGFTRYALLQPVFGSQ